MIEIVRYRDGMQEEWDAFIDRANNAHFFFKRRYFHHQREKFPDHSLLCYRSGELFAVIPAVELSIGERRVWSTHAGLSFAGVVLCRNTGLQAVIHLFSELKGYLLREKVTDVEYRAMPFIYYETPALEDRYALFTHGAKLSFIQPYSVITPQKYPGFNSRQRRRVKSLKSEIETELCDIDTEEEMDLFYEGLFQNLGSRHGVKPVHSGEELQQLVSFFPGNIRLRGIRLDGELAAGALLFENSGVVHVQYSYSTELGREKDSLMVLFDALIRGCNENKYFSFGVSTEQNGKVLNAGLINFKERFGAHAIAQESWEWVLR